MSLQLVLSHYLASLRERNELDALLPELLKAMGHSVLSRPQIGVAQAGVDLVSACKNSAGVKEVFLWVVKFGDVGRSDLYSGDQAIEPSVREAYTNFATNRLPAALRGLPAHIIAVSNGILKQDAQDGFAALTKAVAEARPGFDLDFWGLDHLTPLIEAHLFDEALLLKQGKSDLRAALAGLEESETAVKRFIRFVEDCFDAQPAKKKVSAAALKRRILKQCAAVAMGYGVLTVWARAENNLKPAAIAGEYVLLRLWGEGVAHGLVKDKGFLERMQATLHLHFATLLAYTDKTLPTLLNPQALLGYRPNPVFYADVVFSELGRLACLLLLAQHMGAPNDVRVAFRNALIEVFNKQSVAVRPVLDGQSIDLSLALCAIFGEGDRQSVFSVLRGTISQLRHALQHDEFLPVDTDLLEDAIAAQFTGEVTAREFFQTSSLIPMLATTAALAHDEEALAQLRALHPLLESVTLERWSPTVELERLTGSKGSVEVGNSRALAEVRDTVAGEIEASLTVPSGASKPEEFRWHDSAWIVLVALSARLHRHPVPTWFMALCASNSLEQQTA